MSLSTGGTTVPGTPSVPIVIDSGSGVPVSGSVPTSGGGSSVALASAPAAPRAAFTYTVYAGGLVGFVDKSVGLISARLWSFGDGQSSVQSSVLHQYLTTGTFKVELTVRNAGGSSTTTQNVVIPAVPIVTVVDYSYVVGALGVQFTDISTKAGDRIWDFGDGTTSTETSPYHLYTTPGIYTVTLSISGVTKSYQVSVDYGIVLNWQDNSGDETGFKIERSADGVSGWTLIATVGAGVATLTVTNNLHGVDPAVENHFRVYAYSGDENSGYTNVVETLCGV